MSISTLRRCAITEQPSTQYIGYKLIMGDIAAGDQGFQDYCVFHDDQTHDAIVANFDVVYPGVNNLSSRLKLTEIALANNAKFKNIIKDAIDPDICEYGMPITNNQKFGVSNADGTRPFDCHTFMRSLRAAVREAPNLYIGTIANKIMGLKSEGVNRPKQRIFAILSLAKDYMELMNRPYSNAELIAFWIQTLPSDQQELRLMYWNVALAADANALPMAFMARMVAEEARAFPNVQVGGMSNLLHHLFDPALTLSLMDTSVTHSSMTSYALSADSPSLISTKMCGSCVSLFKSRVSSHPKPEMRVPCKVPRCAGTIVLDPKAPCDFHKGGHSNEQCKTVNQVASRYSAFSLTPSAAAGSAVRGGGGAGGGGKKSHALTIDKSSFIDLNSVPADLARVDGCSQVNLISSDMIGACAKPGSFLDNTAHPLDVTGVSGTVNVTSQITFKNSSMKVYVLPAGHSLDYPIICESDLRRQSWKRNEINDLPFLTHPSLPAIRLYEIDDNMYVSFNVLFSAGNLN